MLRSTALIPWARGLFEWWGCQGIWRGHDVKLPASLEVVVHEANTWLRACDYNFPNVFEGTDDWFPDDPMLAAMLRNPPPALLAAAPGMARCQMKRAVKACDSLYRLLSEEEKAGLVTEADLLAEKTFYRADGFGIVLAIDGGVIISPTDMDSWVVWALREVRFCRMLPHHSAVSFALTRCIAQHAQVVVLLFLVAWCGRSLHEPVPPELDPSVSHKVPTHRVLCVYIRLRLSDILKHKLRSGRRRAWRTPGASR